MDEDAETLEQLQTTLQREGYSVLVAADGHAALQLAKRTKPNLIVSDLLLAGLDSYEVWRLIRMDKDIPQMPILVTSALSIPPRDVPWRPNPNAEWRLLSYDAFLPKPIDLRRFARVVKKLLQPEHAKAIPGGPSVTIAIEDKDFRSKLTTILADHDFEVETPASLGQSSKLLAASPPAVLLLDYRNQDESVRNIIAQTKKFTPNTVIILIIDPACETEAELLTDCDGFLRPPLHQTETVAAINQVVERCWMSRRTELLSTQLITTNRDLRDAQHVLRAQNEELQYVNAELKKLDSLKETFTGMVVHDLRTPLASIFGTLSFLSTDPDLELSDTNKNLLTGAMAAANQLVRLTETLLEGQRLEKGHLELDNEPFDFPTVADVSVRQLSSLLTMHQLEVQTIIPDNLPLVYADPHISQRILENLLDNAIKFSPRGSTVTLRTALEEEFIKVSIEDEGPGIPKDQQEAIFEQYAQLQNSANSSSRGGFGLGLTFCNLATQAMGGSIWVESDGKSGTKFLFTVPIYEED
jgi:signal transduction histidine kinase